MQFPYLVRASNNAKSFKLTLAAIISIGHLVALFSYGATFWVDGIIYLDMAHYLMTGNLSQFYSPIMTCIASHFPLLPSLIWTLLYPVFANFTWIIFASIQHLVAGVGLFYLILALRKYLAKTPLLIATVVLICYPFYQSFHNMVMTESLASSFLIIMVAASIFVASKSKRILLHEMIFMGATFLGIQSRPQIALFALGLIFFQVFSLRTKLWKYVMLGIFVVFSYFAFPLLRWATTGEFFQPSIACLSVRTSLMSQIGQSNPKAVEIISQYDFPEVIAPSESIVEGLTYEQSLAWSNYLIGKGMSEKQANLYMQKIANEIRFSDMESITSQIDSAFSGIGLLNLGLFHRQNEVISEGMTKEYWTRHYTNHYRWLSWTSEADHTDIFDDFTNRFIAIGWYNLDSINMMIVTMRPYISKSILGRDIFYLSKIPTDLFTLLWLIGIISLIRHRLLLLASALGIPVVINYFVVLFVGFGNIRYFYLAAPFVVITATITAWDIVALIRSKILLKRKIVID